MAAAAAAGLGAPPFEACLRVLWGHLVGDRLRHAAYTLDVAVQELIFIVGPLVALAAAWLAGPAGGLAVIAAVQAAGTLLFTTAPVAWGGGAAALGRSAAKWLRCRRCWSRRCWSVPGWAARWWR